MNGTGALSKYNVWCCRLSQQLSSTNHLWFHQLWYFAYQYKRVSTVAMVWYSFSLVHTFSDRSQAHDHHWFNNVDPCHFILVSLGGSLMPCPFNQDITLGWRFLFPDSPTNAWFLTPDERAKAVQRIKVRLSNETKRTLILQLAQENQTGVENKRFKMEQYV